jgi:transposase-like protein
MTKYRKEEKIAAIKAIEAGYSIADVARQFQINDSILELAVRSYREHGEGGLSSHAYNWSAKQKYEVLNYMNENQLSLTETGVRLGIRDSTIWQWEQRYLGNGMEGLENKKKGRKPRAVKPKPPKTREEELLERIEDLEIENEYLKKLNALVAEREKREKGNR